MSKRGDNGREPGCGHWPETCSNVGVNNGTTYSAPRSLSATELEKPRPSSR